MSPRATWASTFTRFRAGPTPVVGSIGVRVSDWSRPQPGGARMFDHPLLERLTTAHPVMPLAVYGPWGGWLLWRALQHGGGAGLVAAGYVSGLLAWSLFEYFMHRLSFHQVPKTPAQVAYGYLIHGVHHAYPDDSRRWVMPLITTLPIGGLLYAVFTLVVGRHGDAVLAGFAHGYLSYDLLHYLIHRGRMPTQLGRSLRQHHLAHHFASPDRRFGVTSPLWDVVFRTR